MQDTIQTGMKVRVTMKNETIEGRVLSVSGENKDILFINYGGFADVMKVFLGAQEVEIVKEHKTENDLLDWLEGNAFDFTAEIDDEEATYVIEGSTHRVIIMEDEDSYTCETINYERYERKREQSFTDWGIDPDEEARGNSKERKTVAGAIGYILTYINLTNRQKAIV